MRIAIGSKNISKITAVKEILVDYPFLAGAAISFYDVSSGVSAHPTTLEESIQGAKNRAKNAFQDCEWSVGLESGLVPIPHSKTGYMDFSVCALYDGKSFHIGLSSGFEYPPQVLKRILQGEEGSDAMRLSGVTNHARIGDSEGGISGLLSHGIMTRKEQVKQSLRSALIPLQNPELY